MTASRKFALAECVTGTWTPRLMAAIESADKCRPGDPAHLRELGAKVLLEQLAKLPREEKLTKYESWLEAHPDADDYWDGNELAENINAGLPRDAVCRAAEKCVLGRPQS